MRDITLVLGLSHPNSPTGFDTWMNCVLMVLRALEKLREDDPKAAVPKYELRVHSEAFCVFQLSRTGDARLQVRQFG